MTHPTLTPEAVQGLQRFVEASRGTLRDDRLDTILALISAWESSGPVITAAQDYARSMSFAGAVTARVIDQNLVKSVKEYNAVFGDFTPPAGKE